MDEYREKASAFFEQNEFSGGVEYFREEAIDQELQGNTAAQLTCELWANQFRIILGEYQVVHDTLPILEVRYAQTFSSQDPLLSALYFYLRANTSYYLGQYEYTRRYAKQALSLVRASALGDPLIECEILMVMGKSSWRRGDLVDAFTTLIEAARTAIQAPRAPSYVLGKIINLMGVVAMDMRYPVFALRLLQVAERLYGSPRSGLPDEHLYYAILYDDLALCHLRMSRKECPKRVRIARQYAERAKVIFHRIFPVGAHRYRSFVLKVEARIIKESKRSYRKIIRKLDEKIALRRVAYGDRPHASIARAYNQQTRACLRAGDLQLGLEKADMALRASSTIFAGLDRFTVPSFNASVIRDFEPEMLKALHNKAELFLKIYRKLGEEPFLKGALDFVQAANDTIQHLKNNFTTEEARLILVGQSRPIHQLGMNILWEIYRRKEKGKSPIAGADLNAIFKLLQHTKSSLLPGNLVAEEQIDVDLLLEEDKDELLNINQFLEELCRILEGIEWIPRQVIDFTSFEARVGHFFGRREERTRELIEEEGPSMLEFYKIDTVQAGFTNDETAIISYFVGEEDLFAIFMTRKDFQVRRLLRGKRHLRHLQRRTTRFKNILDREMPAHRRNRMHTLRRVQDPKRIFIGLAYKLYQLLIAPFPLQPIHKLYIIPDDFLWAIPFEAFITRRPPRLRRWIYFALAGLHHRFGFAQHLLSYLHHGFGWVEALISYLYHRFGVAYHHLTYLHHHYVIAYHYSIPMLCRMHHPHNGQRIELPVDSFLAAIGYIKPAYNNPNKEQDAANLLQGWVDRFEQAGVPQSFPYVHSRHKMDIARFLKFLENIQVIYLLAYGGIEKEQYELIPAIQMAEEEYIKISDLPNTLRLDCNLLILHSCFSGAGPIRKGEGAMALSRAFVQRGARNVIYSLFRIPEHATKMMVDLLFHTLLDADCVHTIADALNETKEELSKKEAYDPSDWAGMAFVGDLQAYLRIEK